MMLLVGGGVLGGGSVAVGEPVELTPPRSVGSGTIDGEPWSLSVYTSDVGECVDFTYGSHDLVGGGCGFGLLAGEHSLTVGILTDVKSNRQIVMGIARSDVARVAVETADGEVYAATVVPTEVDLELAVGRYIILIEGHQKIATITATGVDGSVIEVQQVPDMPPAKPPSDPSGGDH